VYFSNTYIMYKMSFLKCKFNYKSCFLQEHSSFMFLKGKCHEISNPRFFHQTILPWPLINRLKPFWILLRIRRDVIDFRTQKSSLFCIWFSLLEVVRKFFCACGVNDTACTMLAVSMTPHAPWMRYQRHRMHRACGVNDTACILKNSNIFANSSLYSKRL
jgi:hypothetical protein